MAEFYVGFLHKMVSCLPQSDTNESLKLLRSFYLMRCKEITSRYKLPIKHFSQKIKCPRCCMDWNKDTAVEVNSIKLSSRQKQRIKSKQITNANEKRLAMRKARKALLQCNQMEQTCSFCKHTTVTILQKPEKGYPKKSKNSNPITKTPTSKQTAKKLVNDKVSDKNKNKPKEDNIKSSKKNILSNTNVYSNAFDVFSLKNKQNTLVSTIKEPPKIIKNNKKKKDKFAGLCQKAVLASAKLKQDQAHEKTKSKLGLFLKPSCG